MRPSVEVEGARVFLGDCRDVLKSLPDNSVDSIVTDPPYELGFMGKSWDNSGIAYDVTVWEECLRVLKPGGHILAFGGTRTWHRLAVAIEDAGFQLRDSIAWLYSSGFPKSLDVSKAVDKKLGAEREVVGSGPNASRRPNPDEGMFGMPHGDPVTAPATPEAQQWQGWGTALKPAFEPVVVGRKPLGAETAVRAIIENELTKRGETEIRWTRLASDAIKQSPSKHSGSTKAPKTAEAFAKTASGLEMQSTGETTPNSIGPQHDGLQSETQADSENLQEKPKQTLGSKSLTTTETNVPVVGKAPDSSSPSTTLKGGELDTESALTGMSGQSFGETGSLTVIKSFAGIATGLPGESASVLINKLSDGSFQWPDGLPEVFKGGSTVAENVLAWGVGGLNIDGSRIRTDEDTARMQPEFGVANGVYGFGAGEGRNGQMSQSQGRWPANVVLDEFTAGLLDEQSGVSVSKAASMQAGLVEGIGARNLSARATAYESVRGHDDSGGASRFFYQAKASRRDRNEGLETPSTHPTVKPTQLMRYLIKLVTPEGGTVLDPFTGSGSTGKAALLDGYEFIGAELTEEYLPIIEGRLRWAVENRDEETLF